MIERQVIATGKDSDGDILRLCNNGQWWSPRSKADAITDIEGGSVTYYVGTGSSRVDIHVVKGTNGKYLRTDPDKTSSNNLDDLPDC